MTKEEKIVSTALYISVNTNASEKHITCSEIIQALYALEKHDITAEEIQCFNEIYDLVGGKEAAKNLLKIADIEIGETNKNDSKAKKQCKEIIVKW